ncbi:hypothetical protein POM88_035427 [Heracleum sosnowskyi]|uniref:poly(A)-specific ribonuclease n=1 Tax=Heracleum sosnowskyi TaxID=360622 RepID=A0AAD8HL96_9APIA|nr:hypothetical protein POM88_035427 [Heracleum sosnowskyi]
MAAKTIIVDVWSNNFEKEFRLLEKALEEFLIVAMDTEFAGMLDKSFTKNNFDLYTQMRSNVNKTKCIQVGFALSFQWICLCSDQGYSNSIRAPRRLLGLLITDAMISSISSNYASKELMHRNQTPLTFQKPLKTSTTCFAHLLVITRMT